MNFLRIDSKGSPLLQLCDLLLGKVIFDLKISNGILIDSSFKNSGKLSFSKYIDEKADIDILKLGF